MRFARKIIIWVTRRHTLFFQFTADESDSKWHIDSHSICAVSGKWFLLTDVAKNHGGHWPMSTVLPADGRRRQKVNHCVQIDSHPPPDTQQHWKKSFSGLMEWKLSTVSIKSGGKQVNLTTIPAQKHSEGLMLVGVLWKAEPGTLVRVEEKQNTATFFLKTWSRVQRLCHRICREECQNVLTSSSSILAWGCNWFQ